MEKEFDYQKLAESVADGYPGDHDKLVGIAMGFLEGAKDLYASKERDYPEPTYVSYWFKRVIEDYFEDEGLEEFVKAIADVADDVLLDMLGFFDRDSSPNKIKAIRIEALGRMGHFDNEKARQADKVK